MYWLYRLFLFWYFGTVLFAYDETTAVSLCVEPSVWDIFCYVQVEFQLRGTEFRRCCPKSIPLLPTCRKIISLETKFTRLFSIAVCAD